MKIYSEAELEERARSQPDMLIQGLLPSVGVTVLAGEPGLGKSFLALSMAHAVSTGLPWCKRKINPGPIAYVMGEGANFFGRRTEKLRETSGAGFDENSRFIDATGADLSHLADQQELAQILQSIKPRLVVIDTLSALYTMTSENDNAEMAKAMQGLGSMSSALECSVLVIHHVTKSTGVVRGASALVGNVDAVIMMKSSEKKTGAIADFYISTQHADGGKMRDAEPIFIDGFAIDNGTLVGVHHGWSPEVREQVSGVQFPQGRVTSGRVEKSEIEYDKLMDFLQETKP